MSDNLFTTIECEGIVELTLKDKFGNIKDHRKVHNRIVDTGLDLIASLITGQPNDPNFISRPLYIGIGSESTTVTASDVRLHGHLIRKRIEQTERVENNVTFTANFLPGEPNYQNVRIGEVGLYNAPTNGVLFNRCVFSSMYKEIDDELTIRITISVYGQESKYDTLRPDDTPTPTGP